MADKQILVGGNPEVAMLEYGQGKTSFHTGGPPQDARTVRAESDLLGPLCLPEE